MIYVEMGGKKLTRSGEKGTFTAYQFASNHENMGRVDNVVICLHGFPDTISTFKHQIAPLIEVGYRVIVPLMRGYEESSVQSSSQYFLNQLTLL